MARAAFDVFAGEILSAIDADARHDAILLALHGAMVLEDEEDGEGLLLEQIRDRAGREVPIGVSLDLHANVTDRMAALADILISYRTYPHVDQYEIATEVAELIQRTMNGEIRPRTVVARREMLDGADHGRTTAPRTDDRDPRPRRSPARRDAGIAGRLHQRRIPLGGHP